jgi:hypothetical protein
MKETIHPNSIFPAYTLPWSEAAHAS